MADFNAKLAEYADFLMRCGVNPADGQPLLINSPVDCADLTRMLVASAHDAGAGVVDVQWSDGAVNREKYLRDPDASFDEFPDWRVAFYNDLTASGSATFAVAGFDPSAMKGIDPKRMQRASIAQNSKLKEYRAARRQNAAQWSVAAYATPGWAKLVFPDLDEKTAVEKLWDAIFECCLVTGDGRAAERWEEKNKRQLARIAKLDEWQFESLHYSNSLGTDLTVKLPENHIWDGVCETAKNGRVFIPNVPTEEIFTAPHRLGVDGVVHASLPLVLGGNLVDGISMRFEGGRIVEAHAKTGDEYLQTQLELDGARYLGECALVPYSSPIRRSGILFYNTLFDENASCHLAFGSSYACIKGADKLSPEEQEKLGLNQSMTHVDFMIGTADMQIVGRTRDGKEVEVFHDGEFTF